MFGLFAPKCPLETAEKAWVEWRMRWLAHWLSVDRMLEATLVLPTDEFFPEGYKPDEASARQWLIRVCGYMRVDPKSVTLFVVPDTAMPGAAGYYQQGGRTRLPAKRERSQIYVAESQLANPPSLVATLAHEVGHEILLGGEVLTTDVTDHEQITDLLTVFLGLGVFNANATVQESNWNYGATYAGWSIGRQGYLSSFLLGYALAVFAYVRGETSPRWPRHLRRDARETLWKGLRYLRKTGDTLFHPDTMREAYRRPTPTQLAEGLAHRSPSFRLAALWELKRTEQAEPELIPAVSACLHDRDSAVRSEAARAVAMFGTAGLELVPRLLEMLRNDSVAWTSAAETLSHLHANPELVVPELAYSLKVHPERAGSVASALRVYGQVAELAVPNLLLALRRALVSNGHAITPLVAALRDICRDPHKLLAEHFADDPELRRGAIGELKSQQG